MAKKSKKKVTRVKSKPKRSKKKTTRVKSKPKKQTVEDFARENEKNYNEWKNSIDYIYENLQIDTDVEKKYRIFIAKTLQKIPEQARDYIIEKTLFIVCVPNDYTNVERLSIEIESPKKTKVRRITIEQDIAIIDFGQMELNGLTEKQMMDFIANACATLFLGYRFLHKQGITTPNNKMFREACNLAKEWGFNRIYSEADLKKLETK